MVLQADIVVIPALWIRKEIQVLVLVRVQCLADGIRSAAADRTNGQPLGLMRIPVIGAVISEKGIILGRAVH